MKKILVIDDSATSRALFRAYVPKDGSYDLYEAGDCESALELAVKLKPDICVVDYNLPVKNGVEIASDIIEAGVETKFILMTANTQKSVLDSAKALGFIGLIEKPIDAEKVAHILRGIL